MDIEALRHFLVLSESESVSQAAGAMAAPILLTSFIPKSITRPIVAETIRGAFSDFSLLKSEHPTPVQVHCVMGDLRTPSSKG